MSKEMLHTLRLIIPGLIVLIILVPFLQGTKGMLEFKISKDTILYLTVVFGFGVIYYIIDPRKYIMKNPLKKVVENIKDQLLGPFTNDPEIKNSISKLREGDKLTNVFYSFIDNDNSLGERAKEVYINGLIWSSLADLIIISPIVFIAYLVAFLLTNNIQFLILTAICVALFILSNLLTPLVVKRHINLSNYQSAYIIERYRKELRDKLLTLL